MIGPWTAIYFAIEQDIWKNMNSSSGASCLLNYDKQYLINVKNK